ncbi:MAG TPA: 16S rRNA (cytosine(1402)-N(4))-methyltransferase RsmH [Candidatus Omnitrophota bacterium]|nr:16S rRNA (cytosine(1402)-N(4))-methyltransferase RsmH [Candidatus Omnitrophota bacterium]
MVSTVENISLTMSQEQTHIPVMSKEVLEGLNLKPGDVLVDGTLGLAGHASEAAKILGPEGWLIGIDRDSSSLSLAEKNLSEFFVKKSFIHSDFRYIEQILSDLNVDKVNGVLLDLGISSFQLDNPDRGFSIRLNGPLDMRMDQENFISAYDLVNSLSERELAIILKKYGEERWHYRIARFLVEERAKHPIETTRELSHAVLRAIPAHNRHQKIHPATRTFQAFRIAVNRELESLEMALDHCVRRLAPGGRICVISFHSLEDRIVKHKFRQMAKDGLLNVITKKPFRPNDEETLHNFRARSARLRIAEREEE